MIKKIAISTGGGDAPGLNAVIRAVVRCAIKNRGWEVYGIEDGFEGILNQSRAKFAAKTRRLKLDDVRGILPKGGTILGTTNKGNPFKYPVRKGSRTLESDVSDRLIQTFKKLKLDALVTIGGDGTMSISHKLFEKGLPVVGVPKTIDNDLSGTDITFGYDTAAGIVTESLDRLHSTAESHDRIMVVEVMGRDAGWIALKSGIAGGADVIVLPEIPFDLGAITDHLKERKKEGSMFSIIVAAEGARPIGGKPIYQDPAMGGTGTSKKLGGIGYWLARKLGASTGQETRVVVLGHLQRGGSPTTFDRFLATRFGVKAVELIAEKKFGHMVSLKGKTVTSVPITEATSSRNLVDPDGNLVRVAEKLGISLGG